MLYIYFLWTCEEVTILYTWESHCEVSSQGSICFETRGGYIYIFNLIREGFKKPEGVESSNPLDTTSTGSLFKFIMLDKSDDHAWQLTFIGVFWTWKVNNDELFDLFESHTTGGATGDIVLDSSSDRNPNYDFFKMGYNKMFDIVGMTASDQNVNGVISRVWIFFHWHLSFSRSENKRPAFKGAIEDAYFANV